MAAVKPAIRSDCELTAAAEALLEDEAPPPGSHIEAYVAALARRIESDVGATQSSAETAHRRELAGLADEGARDLTALRAVTRAGGRLADHSAPSEILARAPRELGQIREIRRVLLGQVRAGALMVQGCFVRDDPRGSTALGAALGSQRIALRHPLVETEVVRRQRAVVVDADNDPHIVHPHLLTTMRWNVLVVAPVVVTNTVVAVIYADHGPSRPIDDESRALIERFTSELSKAYELAQLRRAIRTERQAARHFARWLDNRSRELTTDGEESPLLSGTDAPGVIEPVRRATPRAEPALFGGVLTSRELEVLELLSQGLSNRRIASALILSPATIKSHVYRILTKLKVANRAEAVALYLARQA